MKENVNVPEPRTEQERIDKGSHGPHREAQKPTMLAPHRLAMVVKVQSICDAGVTSRIFL
jgi:hypothetical protein